MHMGDTQSPTAERPDLPSAGQPSDHATACGLMGRHFVLQHKRPGHLVDVDLVAMDPYLRGLLFTDGTVTRTLEVQALSPVSVEVVAQQRSPVNGEIADCLGVQSGTDAVQRRVVINVDSSAMPAIWAESHIIPSRLPRGFLDVLDDSRDGIGESLQQVKLESWREMLWFGLDTSPAWGQATPDGQCAVLRRLYRVITAGCPAMLISECFAIEQRAGAYHLAG
jgi:chorismate-pyruvate lyase